MDDSKLAAKIAELTSNLIAKEAYDQEQLTALKRVAVFNIKKGLQKNTLAPSGITELNIKQELEDTAAFEIKDPKLKKLKAKKIPDLSKYVKENLAFKYKRKERIPVFESRSVEARLPINLNPAAEEWRWNQVRSEALGPFLTEQGQQYWFDLYTYDKKLTVRSKADGLAQFLFSNARRRKWQTALNNTKSVALAAGHVWINSKMLSASAATNSYVGFNIKGGTFSISNSNEFNGDFLDFSGAFTGSLTLELVQPKPSLTSFEGCEAGQKSKFEYPKQLKWVWKNGQLKELVGEKGTLDGYGNQIDFTDFQLPVVDRSDINHLFIPCEASNKVWNAHFENSKLFKAKGSAAIKEAYLALPMVTVTTPSTLGEPANSGGWVMKLSSELECTWIGSQKEQPVALPQEPLIFVYPNAFLFHSPKTSIDNSSQKNIKQKYSCWNIQADLPGRVPFELQYKHLFSLYYYCHAEDGETLAATCEGKAKVDRPMLAQGNPIQLKELMTGMVFFASKGNKLRIFSYLNHTDPAALISGKRDLLTLKNALLAITRPYALMLKGTLNSSNPNEIEKGTMSLFLGLDRWKPILPDPYVSNLQGGWGGRKPVVTNRLTNEGIHISTNNVSAALVGSIEWEKPSAPVLKFLGQLPLRSGVGIRTKSEASIQPTYLKIGKNELQNAKEHTIDDDKKKDQENIDRPFDQIHERLIGWKLLDVSTNMDLIGVSVSPLFSREGKPNITRLETGEAAMLNTGLAPTASHMLVKDLAMHTPLSMVNVFTLPQVQWEPVRTLPEDQNEVLFGWYPENLSSADDGGPTHLIGTSQVLTPIIPDIVAQQIRDSFDSGHEALALTTLAFGLKVAMNLTPQEAVNRNADAIDFIQPSFPDKKMTGGIQVQLSAEAGNPKNTSPSPGFKGLMAQSLNGYELSTGTPLGLSVLGATLQSDASVETQFNKEFSGSGTNPFVPVTRFDISGYGGSNYSEWENEAALASIGKVKFNINVGRTALEVVKFVSKIYPWGTTVTRSVTIERRSGGGVIRKDSGWQPNQTGILDFRAKPAIPNNPYTFSPGVFRGCFDLVNIRPASDEIITFTDPANGNNVELAPVYFDANIKLEGQESDKIVSTGILGFIQLAPKPDATVNPWMPQLLSTRAFQELIEQQGPIGGPIDTILEVGNAGLKFRATRFEVDVTDNAGTTNFIGVVRGQPLLPNNGSWSVVKMAAPGNLADPQEATTTDISKGTPLLLANNWLPPVDMNMNVSAPSGRYRFIDPTDLFAAQPRYDYCFMQNTGSQSFLFRRPEIAFGMKEILSNLPPAFADPFAMMTSKGAFPPVANAIVAPNANFKLLTQSNTNQLKLNQDVNLNNPRSPLILSKDGVDEILIEYADSKLRLRIGYDDWSVTLDKFVIWTSLMGIERFSGVEYNLVADNQTSPKLVNNSSFLKKEIQDALRFLPGMGDSRDVPTIELGMTNAKHEVKVHTSFSCKIDFLKGKVKCLPGSEPKKSDGGEFSGNTQELWLKFKGSVGVDSVKDTSLGTWEAFFGATVGAELQGKIPISGPIFMVLGLMAEVALRSAASPTTGTTEVNFKSLSIAAYVGVGVGGSIGPFSANAFIAAGIVFVYENDTAKLGGLVRLEANVDLKIVQVNIFAELKGVVYKGDYEGETNVDLIDATGTVGVNVSILFVFSIKASYAYITTQKL
ncbi:hypothetical protein [Ascidiimonas sp. W6]|uniref:hypothetical protein n=1 Tax=Ascidiimonas meishanensis TaxID=3128903 RepID=UPI0030EB4ADC